MYSFPRLAGRFGAERLLVVGAIAFALRAALAALATEPAMLVAIAPLEGIGFAGTFVGGVTVLAARAPAGTQRHGPGPPDRQLRAGDDPRVDARGRHRGARSGSRACSPSARSVSVVGAAHRGAIAIVAATPGTPVSAERADLRRRPRGSGR